MAEGIYGYSTTDDYASGTRASKISDPCLPFKPEDIAVAIRDTHTWNGKNPVSRGTMRQIMEIDSSGHLFFTKMGEGSYRPENWRRATWVEAQEFYCFKTHSKHTTNSKTNSIMEKGRITADLIGAYVSCKHYGNLWPRARIQYEGGRYFLCQDHKAGDSCSHKFGYLYSYSIGDGTKLHGANQGITEITLLPESYHLIDGSKSHVPDLKPYKEPEGKFKLSESLFKPDKLPKLNQFN